MTHVLHIQKRDGSTVHVDFDRRSWYDAMGDPNTDSQWTHAPDDCHDPVKRIREWWESEPKTQVLEVLVLEPKPSVPAPIPPPPKIPKETVRGPKQLDLFDILGQP